jgi:hypothetical protein
LGILSKNLAIASASSRRADVNRIFVLMVRLYITPLFMRIKIAHYGPPE